ncbi:MAG: bifunctional diaminohydroxyphosphoribosylaminopyrimidine deaminase/5-amino-6-(5-phosphoribosylamino)uracil reductase RibD [Candidatus Cybelea sp.]
MEHSHRSLTPLDELYLHRAYELAARGIGSTSPNPPVGAVVVRENRIVGEGYHHRAGEAHAETNALRQAGRDASGATLYVSLEPCRHVGRTPPCTRAVVEAGIVRVVAGALDPTLHGGAAELRECGVDVAVAHDEIARDLIEPFARAGKLQRPYVALKMAMSLDGAIASRPGVEVRLTSEDARRYVRDLRIGHDAVMVGAGTVRVDDPQLTVRPPHHRLRPYVRVVLCQTQSVSATSRIFQSEEDYAKTIVVAPGGLVKRLEKLRSVADVIGVGPPDSLVLELSQALAALRAHGIYSVLCEGGPTLAARLIAGGHVDRFYWAIAPLFLRSKNAVPVLAGADLLPPGVRLRFDRVERTGEDVVISGTVADV